MIQDELLNDIASRLRHADEQKITCEPIRTLIGENNIESAYKIQKINTAIKVNGGVKVLGKKIGLTSFAVQKQLGIDQPDFGVLWEDTQIANGGSISIKELIQPKAEAEIAFVLGREINQENISIDELIDSIEYAVAAIEIVGSRIKNWDIKIADTIADNASASHWVMGDQKVDLGQIDLVECKMEMYNNGELVSEGFGKNCMDSPLNAVKWLSDKMSSLGQPLQAGDIIFSGALGPMVKVSSGDSYHASIENLGSVAVSFFE